MKALIVERTPWGTTRSCGSRCWEAQKPKCVCCCGGRNHGVGARHRAVEITKGALGELYAESHERHLAWIKNPERGSGPTSISLAVHPDASQMRLPI